MNVTVRRSKWFFGIGEPDEAARDPHAVPSGPGTTEYPTDMSKVDIQGTSM